MSVAGKVVVVTGGAGAIGRAVAGALGRAGAQVVVADIDLDAARSAAEETGGAAAIALDVSEEAACDALADASRTAAGGFDGIVHCAGIGAECALSATTLEMWSKIQSINLTGTFLICRTAARHLPRGGAIVTIASTAGEKGSARRAAYAASKAGVISLTQTMAVECAAAGIRANSIAPGPIETELTRRMHGPETRRAFESRVPLARYGLPDEVAGAAVFLLSDDARFITGHVLNVDGGFLAAGIM